MSDLSLDGLRDLFHRAGTTAVAVQLEPVVKKAAVNVKKTWRDNARASVAGAGHARAYPSSITFDGPVREGNTISAEVGPDKNLRQGALGNLIEYGSAHNPPHWDGKRAAEAEAEGFAKYVGDAGEAVLMGTDFWSGKS
jgi:hypothetical protein